MGWLSMVLRSRQHSIGSGQKTQPTVTLLKEKSYKGKPEKGKNTKYTYTITHTK